MKESRVLVYALLTCSVMVITACGIYLTPLKHFNLIAPEPNDIDPKVLYAEMQAHPDQYLFLDVRDPDVYARSHAKDAINQPIGTFFDIRNSLPKSGKQIVLICTSGRLAGVAYGFLQNWGYGNLIRIKGGTQAWLVAGLPLEGNNLSAPLPLRD